MRGKCRLFQVSIGIYEFITGNTENCGGVLPRTAIQGFCHRPSVSLRLSLEGKIQNNALFVSIHCTVLPRYITGIVRPTK